MTLKERIKKQYWKKTTYIQPHEYILEPWNKELFDEIKKMINKNGYEVIFLGKAYRCLNIGEYKYWYMEDVLNRALLPKAKENSSK